MKKLLSISLIPIFAVFLFGAFFALPADAQTPTESCTLVRNVKIEAGTLTVLGKNSVVGADKSVLAIKAADGTTDVTIVADSDEQKELVKKWGTICLVNTINTVVDWIFIFLIAVSVALIAIAGFMYMTAAGNPEQQKKAGGMIMGAVIGIVIALLARLVPALITGILV